MNKITSLAALGIAAIIPVTLATPAFAVDYDRLNLVIDCDLGELNEDDHIIREDETLTINFIDCSGVPIMDDNNDGINVDYTGWAVYNGTPLDDSNTVTFADDDEIVTVSGGPADLEIDISDSVINNFDVDVYVPLEVDAPDSTLLATETLTLELGGPDTMIREEMIGDPDGDNGDGRIWLGGNETCDMEPGPHIYTTHSFSVEVAGTYDFRSVLVDPIDEDLNWGAPQYPSSDPFLVVYEDFDVNDFEAGVIGCNDDLSETGFADLDAFWTEVDDVTKYDALLTETGYLLDRQSSWFRTDLEPGDYTLVYMPFSAMGADDFAVGEFDDTSTSDDTWEPVAQSVTYEIWGPEGGFGEEDLAATGVNPAFALWTGLALAGTGVAMTVARRRAESR